MYYQPNPKYFSVVEFFSPTTIDRVGSGQVWRLFDWRILYTINEIRFHFGKPIHINNWKWGGSFSQRGFRAFEELVDWENLHIKLEPKFSSFTSQHCFGRALDFDVDGMSAKEIREDIFNNHGHAARYQYITAIEDNVNWVHIDVRSWDVGKVGLLIF